MRNPDNGVRMALWRFVHWRSLEDTVEGQTLEESGIQFYCKSSKEDYLPWKFRWRLLIVEAQTKTNCHGSSDGDFLL